MKPKMINVGFNNYVPEAIIMAVVVPDSAPVRRKLTEAKRNGTVIDITFGRKTRSIIFTKENVLILSAINPETLAKRYNSEEADVPQNAW